MAQTRPLKLFAAAALTALTLASCGAPDAADSESSGDALTLGTLLPQTGSLAFLGPPQSAGVNAAVTEINAAGGVNGANVEVIDGDSGDTSTNIASGTVDRELAGGVDVILGAASSAVTLSVIDKIIGAGVLQFSPANTSTELSTYPSKGLYFRTAPPDLFQGAVLAQVALNDRPGPVAILALQDPYGTGLADAFEKNFTGGGGTIASKIIYDAKASSFEAEVSQAKAANPAAIVLIGFDESKKILQELIKQGIGPDTTQLYLVDGNLTNTLAQGLPAGIMQGAKGTTPGAQASQELRDKLLSVNPDLRDFSYGAESFDATTITALAAVAANSTRGEDIAKQIPLVTAFGNTEVHDFASGAKALSEGEQISYVGYSGATDLQSNGDPTTATMGVYEYGADNTYTLLDSISGAVPTS